ncbi:hypothetical protein F25303_13809 [Fusarium sp. NRRL 25303]|nr:hypothetical protein F25303_13809 [Fusarium sp. NRRL 25303]
MSTFPPSSWLGYGLDMTVVSPNDINAVTSAILTAYALIPIDDSATTPVKVADAAWDKPKNLRWTLGQTEPRRPNTSRPTMAVSGDASVSYSVDSTFEEDRSYALFSYNQLVATCAFESWGQSVDKITLATAISGLNLLPFDPSNKSIIDSYRSLFEILGSHIVVGATYGGRMQMTTFASNSDTSYESSITADVGLAYKGLCTSGQFDISIAPSDQYKIFSRELMQQVSCRGGDAKYASSLNTSYQADKVYEIFTKWVQTAHKNPGVMSLHTAPLWDVMTATFDPQIIKHSADVKMAYEWIMENPLPHWTNATVTINLDWGEFGIISPNATIIQDPQNPLSVDNIVFNGAKILWGKEQSHNFQRDVKIMCIIVNDGSPLNFELSHGCDGSAAGEGRIDITINGTNYPNSTITDNNWNTQFFYNAPVNPNAHVTSSSG